MLKTNKFNILPNGKIVVGEIAVFTASGNCCWGSCLGELVTEKVALEK